MIWFNLLAVASNLLGMASLVFVINLTWFGLQVIYLPRVFQLSGGLDGNPAIRKG